MSITDRDRKVLLGIIPLVLIVAYWFLLLAPKREEASQAAKDLTEQQQKRDELEAQARQVETAKASFTDDYARLVSLGKAVPTKVDMPSLLVQLEDAAKGTGIKFTSVKQGEAAAAPAPAPAPSGEGGDKPTDAGGQPAQSAPGQAAESANNAAATSDQRNQAAEQTGVDAQTSSSSKQGGLPVGGGATNGAASGGSSAPGLDSVPLEFEFNGSFFDLADFFHRLKRFVRLSNKKLEVKGRLMTIDGLKFSSEDHFPSLKAEVKATVWLSPEKEGATAGATPAGPAQTQQAASGSGGVAGPDSAPSSTPTPTATATP